MKRLIHTPEGVRDIYGDECRKKHSLQNRIHQNIAQFGYRDIETPTFEFFDVFSREIGTTPSKELYKFFDKEGNTLVLRPDFTPSIGRCAAKYFTEEALPVRLTYMGNTFTNTSNLQGKLKETTQMGVELIGDGSVMADAEMIHLAVSSLKAAGLSDFQISIGEIGFFKGICRELELDEDTEEALRENISDKNYFGAEEILSHHKLERVQIDAVLKLTELFGSYEILEEAEELIHNEMSLAAVTRLKSLYQYLLIYEDEKYVSFDLGLLSKYHYYTGILMKGYTYGSGDAILQGGRYDSLLSYFGKDSASIGFVINIDGLMQAMNSRKLLAKEPGILTMLLYEEGSEAEAIRYAKQMRILNESCVLYCLDSVHDEAFYLEQAKKQEGISLLKISSKGIKELYKGR